MGLFNKLTKGSGAEGKKETPPVTFSPIIIDTQDVVKELKNVATANNVDVEVVDFKILKVTTLYRQGEEEEWKEVSEEARSLFDEDDFFLNPELKVEQHFKVEIFDTRAEDESTPMLPPLSLGANKNLTKTVVTIKKSVDIRYSSNFENALIEAINKKKIKAKILVGIREGIMRQEVKKIAASVRINNIIEKDSTFVVMEGIDPVLPVNDALIVHYKKKINAEDKQGRVDYSRRGYLEAVGEGEVILEYVKPQEGSPGKTCRGVFLPVNEPKVTNESTINITENIIKKEDDKTIRYIAKCSGYVKEAGGTYDIQDQMELDEINFKTTGSIEAGLDRNVTINIKESDAFKDAIGTGMSVESTELNVDGNVGSQANIRARKVRIGGQTHMTSTIWADTANISVHRGTLEATEVTIDRLEGGKVIADVVRVKSVIGGEIIARQIYIETLASNAQITTSELIEIQELKGSNNKFLVDPASAMTFKTETASLTEKIEKARKSLDSLPKQLENKKNIIDKNKQSVEMIKAKIEELKAEGQKPPATFMGKLKDYQQLVNEYNLMLKAMKDYKFQLNDYKEELNQMQSKIFSAKIINHSPWKEYNEIKFKLISPAIEVEYNTKNHEISKMITLVQTSDDKFKINRSSQIER
ncbi:MAG: DUF342 domain-containing protein [Campylobacterales bacterium]|nr:DUF342 domain-containing protein [Campylobacterales bacterium]